MDTVAAMTTSRAAWTGVVVTALLVVAAFTLPHLLDWEVNTRAPRSQVDEVLSPPFHGWWAPQWFGPGTLPAIALGLGGWWWVARWAPGAGWRPLLLATYLLALGWCLSLALVDGPEGLSRVLGNPVEYLPTAREVDDVGLLLREYVERISYDAAPRNWPTHVAGHPPLMLLFFVGLVQLGLGGDLAAGVVVTVVGASMPVAVLVALRALGVEGVARRVAVPLALSPAAVFVAVSADAVIGAVVAWGLACLALATRSTPRARLWAVPAGLVLGCAVLMSYGMPLVGLVALAVITVGGAWRTSVLPVAVAAAWVPVLGFAAAGFAWWEAYPVLHDRYWEGIAADRPAWYWLWGNLAALAVVLGPMVWAGLAVLLTRARALARRTLDPEQRAVVLLAGAMLLVVLAADASRMSKSEVERIWLPFVPWLTLSVALLPARWRSPALLAQVVTALLVQHLLYTTW
ncbi:unannotated protein [freshwater metagenome]|uniref:Unannotated protein n=1 Tax=freshwater metagenome TaxID=449393 RepID=A0A6J6SNH5_9ZZZZ